MIEVKNLWKAFGNFEALRGVSFSVDKGRIAGFLGPNGAGKSTTMRILTTFLPPTRGQARVAGLDVTESASEICRLIGYLPETMPIYPEMRVGEYLRFRAVLRRVPRREVKKRVESVMEECALTQMRKRLCGALSKGFRQRLGLADALLHDPEVLILDEPTAGLDPLQVIGVRNLIERFRGTRTVLLSSHVLSTIEQVCDEVIVIADGEVRLHETREEWVRRARELSANTVRVVYRDLRADPIPALEKLEGVSRVEEQRGGFLLHGKKPLGQAVASHAVETGWKLQELIEAPASLESLFLSLTGKSAAGERRGA